MTTPTSTPTRNPGLSRELVKGAAWGLVLSAAIIGAILWLCLGCASEEMPPPPPGPTAEEMAPPAWYGRMADSAGMAPTEAFLAWEPLPAGYSPMPEILPLPGTGWPWIGFGGPRRTETGWEAVLSAGQPGIYGLPGLRDGTVVVYLLAGALPGPGDPKLGLAMDGRLTRLQALATAWGTWHGGLPVFRLAVPPTAWDADGRVVVPFPGGWPAGPVHIQPLVIGAGKAALGFPWSLP